MIKHGGLPGTKRALRLMKSDLNRAMPRRPKCGGTGWSGVANLHFRLNRLPADGVIKKTEIGDLTIRLHQLILRAQYDLT